MRSPSRQQIGWRFALTLLLTNLLCIAMTVAAIRIDANRREARARQASCVLVLLQIKAFDENDPNRLTQTGRDLAAAWREAARVYGC